jgi:hypothetical protein
MKHYVTYLALLVLALLGAMPAHVAAADKYADAAAQLTGFGELLVDTRVDHLRAYLKSHNSPMADDAAVFVREADRNNLDWKLVVAIAGAESTFGKHIPTGSYNGWGWGIPTGAHSGIGFKDWEHGIMTVSEGLKKNYVDRGAVTIEQMGRIYAASPRWAGNVRYFIGKIETFVPTGPEYLEVSI